MSCSTWKTKDTNKSSCFQGIVGCTPIPTYPYGKSLYKPYISLYSGCLWVTIPKNPYISPISYKYHGSTRTLGVHPSLSLDTSTSWFFDKGGEKDISDASRRQFRRRALRGGSRGASSDFGTEAKRSGQRFSCLSIADVGRICDACWCNNSVSLDSWRRQNRDSQAHGGSEAISGGRFETARADLWSSGVWENGSPQIQDPRRQEERMEDQRYWGMWPTRWAPKVST